MYRKGMGEDSHVMVSSRNTVSLVTPESDGMKPTSTSRIEEGQFNLCPSLLTGIRDQ